MMLLCLLISNTVNQREIVKLLAAMRSLSRWKIVFSFSASCTTCSRAAKADGEMRHIRHKMATTG
jgi:hypothetical protein